MWHTSPISRPPPWTGSTIHDVGGAAAGVHAVRHDHRPAAVGKRCFQLLIGGREATIEADLQDLAARSPGVDTSSSSSGESAIGFSTNTDLPARKRRGGDARVQIVARRDQHGVDGVVVDDLRANPSRHSRNRSAWRSAARLAPEPSPRRAARRPACAVPAAAPRAQSCLRRSPPAGPVRRRRTRRRACKLDARGRRGFGRSSCGYSSRMPRYGSAISPVTIR